MIAKEIPASQPLTIWDPRSAVSHHGISQCNGSRLHRKGALLNRNKYPLLRYVPPGHLSVSLGGSGGGQGGGSGDSGGSAGDGSGGGDSGGGVGDLGDLGGDGDTAGKLSSRPRKGSRPTRVDRWDRRGRKERWGREKKAPEWAGGEGAEADRNQTLPLLFFGSIREGRAACFGAGRPSIWLGDWVVG